MSRIDQIILVDNNHKNTSSMQKDLEGAGFAESIKVAVNGEHALLCLEHLDLYKRIKGKKTMIVLNIDTPVVNGISFLEGYRKRYSSEDIFIVVADNSTRENIEKALSLGVTEVLSSPLKVTEIMEAGTKYFAGKTSRSERVVRNRKSESHQQVSV